jgi:hypothetical protein
MAERKLKAGPMVVRTMDEMLDVVDDVVTSNKAELVEFRGGRHVTISPEPSSAPTSETVESSDEVARRLAIVRALHGAWSDIGAEAWKKQIKEERGSDRPYPDDGN